MLGKPQDEALLREVHREGAELNTEVSCDIASDLIKQCLSPGHQHEIDPGSRDLSCEFDAYSGRSPVTSAHGPNCCLSATLSYFSLVSA